MTSQPLQVAYLAYAAHPRLQDLRGGARQLVGGEGPVPARVMVIGEAPGYHEDVQGRPFTGPSGALLDRLLARAYLLRAQCFITNVVKYRPPGNRTPTPLEVGASAGTLRAEMAIVKPEAIVVMGATALWALDPSKRISECHGRPWDQDDILVLPLLLGGEPLWKSWVPADVP